MEGYYAKSGSATVTYDITANTTYDIVITSNNEASGTINIYISKVLEMTGTSTGEADTKTPLNLFRRNGGSVYADVKMDYFALWDIELTQSEINTIPNGSI